MSDPLLTFVKVSGLLINATYDNFPVGAKISVVNKTSGDEKLVDTVAQGMTTNTGMGILLPKETLPGAYFLRAVDANGDFLAQSVVFYLT